MNNSKSGYYIFRPYFKTKNGKVIYAEDYGKKAFRIYINNGQAELRI